MSEKFYVPVYRTPSLRFVKGQGSWLIDEKGRSYLDFFTGIGVNALGHGHPRVVSAIKKQLDALSHVSNLYAVPVQEALAERLCGLFGGGKVFFANTGTEANEAALKFCRKARPGRGSLVAFEGGFHGRSFGSLSITAEKAFRQPFEPLLPDVRFAKWNDPRSFSEMIDKNVAAVILEVVQGEGGIRVAQSDFLAHVAKSTRQAGALLVIDEIQSGIGRTGKMFAYEHFGLKPDLVTLAKALGGGQPLGAVLVSDEVSAHCAPGDHGSTFGGNPVSCAAAMAVLDVLHEDGLLERAQVLGQRIEAHLKNLGFNEVRRLGLMLGLVLGDSVDKVVADCQAEGLLVGKAAGGVLRLLPPLVLNDDDLEKGLDSLTRALRRNIDVLNSDVVNLDVLNKEVSN